MGWIVDVACTRQLSLTRAENVRAGTRGVPGWTSCRILDTFEGQSGISVRMKVSTDDSLQQQLRYRGSDDVGCPYLPGMSISAAHRTHVDRARDTGCPIRMLEHSVATKPARRSSECRHDGHQSPLPSRWGCCLHRAPKCSGSGAEEMSSSLVGPSAS